MIKIKIKNVWYTLIWKNESYGFKKEGDAIKAAKKVTYNNPSDTALIIVWKETELGNSSYEVHALNWILGPLYSYEILELF